MCVPPAFLLPSSCPFLAPLPSSCPCLAPLPSSLPSSLPRRGRLSRLLVANFFVSCPASSSSVPYPFLGPFLTLFLPPCTLPFPGSFLTLLLPPCTPPFPFLSFLSVHFHTFPPAFHSDLFPSLLPASALPADLPPPLIPRPLPFLAPSQPFSCPLSHFFLTCFLSAHFSSFIFYFFPSLLPAFLFFISSSFPPSFGFCLIFPSSLPPNHPTTSEKPVSGLPLHHGAMTLLSTQRTTAGCPELKQKKSLRSTSAFHFRAFVSSGIRINEP